MLSISSFRNFLNKCKHTIPNIGHFKRYLKINLTLKKRYLSLTINCNRLNPDGNYFIGNCYFLRVKGKSFKQSKNSLSLFFLFIHVLNIL